MPTNKQSQSVSIVDNRKFKECVLKGCFPDKEKRTIKTKNEKTKLSHLSKSEIPNCAIFSICGTTPVQPETQEIGGEGNKEFNMKFILRSKRFEKQKLPKLMIFLRDY